jgi:hypothetical protein
MDGRSDEFLDALSMMSAALRLLEEGDCPFDVAAHLDFATHRLGDHLAGNHLALSNLMEISQPNWIN